MSAVLQLLISGNRLGPPNLTLTTNFSGGSGFWTHPDNQHLLHIRHICPLCSSIQPLSSRIQSKCHSGVSFDTFWEPKPLKIKKKTVLSLGKWCTCISISKYHIQFKVGPPRFGSKIDENVDVKRSCFQDVLFDTLFLKK